MRIGTIEITSKNIPVMYMTGVISGMVFFLPVVALYFEKTLFSIANVAIIFAIEAFFSIIFEIPTGAIADIFGRKKTYILAYSARLISIFFLWIGGSMTIFVISALFSALSRSFASGTGSAIIYDSLQEEGKEHYYKKIIGIHQALWPLGASIGSVIGGYMAAYSLRLTVSASLIPIGICLFLCFFLTEPAYEKENHRNIGLHMVNSFKTIIKNKQLVVLMLAFLVMAALGESVHLLSPLFFKFKEIPIIYFGYITAFSFGFSSIGFFISHELSEWIGNKKTLIIVSILSPLLILGATITSGIPLIALWTTPSVFFGIKNPIIDHLLNLETTSSKRATVISINNFMGGIGIAVIAPLFGYLADLYTIQIAVQLSAIAVLIVPVMLVFLEDKK